MYRCINTNFTYSLHVIKKIIIEFVTEYHKQCCSESGRHIFERKESIYKETDEIEEDGTTGMINI